MGAIVKILILGGTIFLGRYLTESALANGHTADLFPEVERLRGDRDGDLEALKGRQWDAVIDTSGYLPRVVRASAELLATAVEHYTFVSSISVYSDVQQSGINETAPVGVLDDPSTEQITGESYGPLKALCEQAVETTLPGRALIVRPGLIVGPHDYSDRFSYWPRRIARGGDVLAPGKANAPVQFIDVRDLAEWIVQMVEARRTGVYNATGPATPLTLGQTLQTCRDVLSSDARLVWVDEAFLLEAGVQPWIELPLWVPDDGTTGGFHAIDCRKATAAGLRYRPLADTVVDTYHWDATHQQENQAMQRTAQPHSMRAEREAELLASWRAQSTGS
jgi:2'-hydroxyisoflavone reductase